MVFLNFLDTLQLMMGLFIPMALAFFLYKFKMVDASFTKGLSALLYNISLPCSILDSMMVDITPAEIMESISLPVLALVIVIISLGAGLLIAKLIEKDKKKHGIIAFSFIFSNFTFTAYPILEKLYDKQAVFYASIYNFTMFTAVLTIGVILIKKSSLDNIDCKLTLKDLFSVPFFALILGIILLFIPADMPAFIKTTVSSLSATTTPLGVMLTGLVVAKTGSFNLKNIKIYIVSVFRLLILPVAAMFILKLLGFTGYMLCVPVIILANPIAVNLVILSENFNAASDESASYVLISSVLSVITLPVIYNII